MEMKKLRKMAQRLSGLNTPPLKNKERNLIWISLTIVSVFFVCESIYILSMLCTFGVVTDSYISYLHPITILLMMINSSVNPFVYGFFSKKYRTVFMRIIKCEKKTSDEFRLSRTSKV